MKKSNSFEFLQNLTEKDFDEMIKNSPSLQKHFEESRRIFNSIPKEELTKALKR